MQFIKLNFELFILNCKFNELDFKNDGFKVINFGDEFQRQVFIIYGEEG